MKSFCLFAFIYAAQAQSLTLPSAGFLLDRTGSLRPLSGISQNFSLGGPIRSSIVNAACGAALCVIKTDTSLIVSASDGDHNFDAPQGPAALSVDGNTALIYLSATAQFFSYANGALQALNWTVDGAVLAVDAHQNQILVRRSDGIWAVTPDGAVQSGFDGGIGLILPINGLILQSTDSQLTLLRSDSSSISFDLAGITAIRQMNGRYAQITTDSATYALRLDPGREELSLLAEVAP